MQSTHRGGGRQISHRYAYGNARGKVTGKNALIIEEGVKGVLCHSFHTSVIDQLVSALT